MFFMVSALVHALVRPKEKKAVMDEAPMLEEKGRLKADSFGLFKTLKKIGYRLLMRLRIAPAGPCYTSFRSALQILKGSTLKSTAKYDLPWTVLVGGRLSGQDGLMEGVRLSQPVRSPAAHSEGLVNWWFYEKGVVLNVDSQCFLSQGGMETSWEVFVRNLQYWRPRNPLDSVVLSVSWEELVSLSDEEIEKEAKKIGEPLRKLEEMLGLVLPLHIVVTKTDVMPGFQGLIELSEDQTHQAVGWSNPYEFERRFFIESVREAIIKIQQQLYQWTMQAFLGEQKKQYRDDIMVFSERLMSLEGPLQKYLKTLLDMGGYRDHFYMRSLCLTGRDEKTGEVRFVEDFLSKKVFEECGVAQPITRIFRSSNTVIGWIRSAILCLSLVWTGALFYDHTRLGKTTHELKHLLTETTHHFYSQNAQEITEEMMYKDGVRKYTENTLRLLDQSARYALFSWSSPASWLSSLERDFDQYVFKLYDYIVARPMYRSFEYKAESLIIAPLPTPESQSKSLELCASASFRTMQNYLEELEALEDKVNLYNALPRTQNIHHFRETVSYLYNFRLTEDFVTEKSFLQDKVLRHAVYQPFYMQDYEVKATERFQTLFNAFLLEAFNPDRLFDTPRALQDLLEQVDRSGIQSLDEIYTLLETIDKTLLLFGKDGSWLARKTFAPPKEIASFLNCVKKTSFLGEKVFGECRSAIDKVFDKISLFLASFGSVMTGHFFLRSEDTGLLMPSVSLISLRKALVLVLKQGFMQRASREKVNEKIEAGQIIHWDKQLIQKALMLIQDYQKFNDTDLQSFPSQIQETVKLIARQQLALNVEALLARAQTFFQMPATHRLGRSEEVARAYADNLQEVSGLFEQMIEGLEAVGAHGLFVKMRDVLFRQMFAHLEELETIVKGGAFFYPSAHSLRWWQGEEGAMFAVYGADDRLELRSVWNNHMRRFKEMMSLHILPVLSLLKSPLMHAEAQKAKVIQRWARVCEQIEAYDTGQDSSIKMLEAFIMEDGNKVTYANHKEHISSQIVNRKASDLFLDVLLSLKKAIFKRCQHIMAEGAAAEYTRLAQFFNANIAGIYPFVKDVPEGVRLESELHPDALQEFYKLLEGFSLEKINSLMLSRGFTRSMKEVQAFLQKMLKIKEFMDLYFIPSQNGGLPSMAFTVEYRAQRDKERLGDHILDWAVISGQKAISLQQGSNQGAWTIGEGFNIGLEFVQESPLLPVKSPEKEHMAILGSRAMFVCEGFWGLLRMIQLQKASPEQGQTGGHTLLAFSIPMVVRTTGVVSDMTQVFMRLVPKTVSGKSSWSFAIPEFPEWAPYFVADEDLSAEE